MSEAIIFSPGRLEASFAASSAAELRRWIEALNAFLPLLDGAQSSGQPIAARKRRPSAAPLPAADDAAPAAAPRVPARAARVRSDTGREIRRWTPADEEKLRALAGKPWIEVARALGRSCVSCEQHARKLGLKGPGRGRRPTPRTPAPQEPQPPSQPHAKAEEEIAAAPVPAPTPTPNSDEETIARFIAEKGVTSCPPAYGEKIMGATKLAPIAPLTKGENGRLGRGPTGA